jgi:hypothetical protein
VRDALGHDPIDDVGYHIHVAQGPGSAASEVGTSAGANLAAMNAVLAKYGIGGKKLWISEIGFRLPLFDEAGQAARLDTTFAALGAPARNDIASIQWFTIADFGGEGRGHYGASFAAKDRRSSHDHFVAQAKAFAPPLAARLEVTLPKQAAVGSKVIAKIKATNLGKTAWDAVSQVRLGAASGCPSVFGVGERRAVGARRGFVHDLRRGWRRGLPEIFAEALVLQLEELRGRAFDRRIGREQGSEHHLPFFVGDLQWQDEPGAQLERARELVERHGETCHGQDALPDPGAVFAHDGQRGDVVVSADLDA